MRLREAGWWLIGLGLLLAACGAGGPSQPPGESVQPTATAALQELVSQAREDLAQRLGIDPVGIEVVEARMVRWPDGALGCPQPGTEYLQIEQEGFLIRLQVGDELFPYHSALGFPLFLCE